MQKYLESLLNKTQVGGNIDIVNEPTAAFPPIYICDKNQINNDNESTNRGFTSTQTSVSVEQIQKMLKERQNKTPFITLDED